MYASTFSKTIAPGLRVGWVVASPELLSPMLVLKQACDLHTSSLDQRVAHAYLTRNDEGPAELDSLQLLSRALEHQVAFVPGGDFFPGEGGTNFIRLNFSNSTPDRIRTGVRRLGALCREA